jgi:hypothetical protein
MAEWQMHLKVFEKPRLWPNRSTILEFVVRGLEKPRKSELGYPISLPIFEMSISKIQVYSVVSRPI